MNRNEFTDFLKQNFESILVTNETKGNDYAGNKDVFQNFKRNGERLNLDPLKVWAVYFFKHLDAIETWLKNKEVKSEPVESRIDDAIMYLLLLKGMIKDGSH